MTMFWKGWIWSTDTIPRGGTAAKIFATVLLHFVISFIWYATMTMFWKRLILTYWSHPKGRGRGAAVKIFGTMLTHSWLQLIWYATWPWRNSQIRLFNICPECSKVPSPRRWPSWAPMAFFSIVSKKIALQLGKLEKPSHQSISILTLCLGAQKNRLNEAIPLSIHNMFSITDIKATFQLLKQWDHSP